MPHVEVVLHLKYRTWIILQSTTANRGEPQQSSDLAEVERWLRKVEHRSQSTF